MGEREQRQRHNTIHISTSPVKMADDFNPMLHGMTEIHDEIVNPTPTAVPIPVIEEPEKPQEKSLEKEKEKPVEKDEKKIEKEKPVVKEKPVKEKTQKEKDEEKMKTMLMQLPEDNPFGFNYNNEIYAKDVLASNDL